jgi:hypothetical protein
MKLIDALGHGEAFDWLVKSGLKITKLKEKGKCRCSI